MIIKIDVDGVIRDIFTIMCKIYNEDFKENLTVDNIFDYDVDKVFTKVKENWGISATEYFFKMHSKELFLLSKPYNDVKMAISELKKAGHKIIITTWQFTLVNKIDTLYFLSLNDIPYDDICFTRDKWMIQGDWLIDDNPEFITDEREKSRKIMINMPYNKNCNFFCTRANDLQHAVDIILEQEQYLKVFLAKKEHKQKERKL